MRLEDLDIAQVHRIYNVRMKEDFPPAELKALKIIEEGIQAGFYRFPGLFDGDEIIWRDGMTVTYEDLSDGDEPLEAMFCFVLNDIFGEYTMTDLIAFEI